MGVPPNGWFTREIPSFPKSWGIPSRPQIQNGHPRGMGFMATVSTPLPPGTHRSPRVHIAHEKQCHMVVSA